MDISYAMVLDGKSIIHWGVVVCNKKNSSMGILQIHLELQPQIHWQIHHPEHTLASMLVAFHGGARQLCLS